MLSTIAQIAAMRLEHLVLGPRTALLCTLARQDKRPPFVELGVVVEVAREAVDFRDTAAPAYAQVCGYLRKLQANAWRSISTDTSVAIAIGDVHRTSWVTVAQHLALNAAFPPNALAIASQ
jgi:hypothetical protein